MEKPGERLSHFAGEWEALKASPQIMSILRHGHKFKFKNKPPLSDPLPSHETKVSPASTQIIRREIRDLVAKGAMRKINFKYATEVKGYYSKLFVVPKPDVDKFRVIINLKPLNKYIKKETFRMEGLKDVQTILEPGAFAGVVDISDAYYHVPIHKKSRKFTRFIFENVIYEYCALPMGLTDSPRVFTHVTKVIQSFLRKRQISIVMYIDDILIVAVTFEECEYKLAVVLNLLRRLGFLLNIKKCNLVPSQKFTYLGHVWDTVDWTVQLKPEREHKLRKAAGKLAASTVAKCREVAAFIGRVQSVVLSVPFARAKVRMLQWDFLASCVSEQDFNKNMEISGTAREELKFWENLPGGMSLPITWPATMSTVTTDATEKGLAVYFEGDLFSESIANEYMPFSINVKELLALDRWLDTLGSEVRDTYVTWRVDNNSALAAIKKQGSTRSWPMCLLSVSILKKAEARNIHILPIRVSSEENLIADAGSRFKDVQDWSLDQSLVQKMFQRWGQGDVDLMATYLSRKLPLYFAWNRQDPEAWGIDALAQDVNWAQFSLPYIFPPFPLIGQVLRKVEEQKVERMLLVAPWWPTKPFFTKLLSMTVEVKRLRFSKWQVMDMATGMSPPDAKRCRLAVFMISGNPELEFTVCQMKHRNWLGLHGGILQSSTMALPGKDGVNTVENLDFHQLPLL